ncbi:MAG: YafY family transcriptional regulator [Anaerolineae bacterium]|nr:YafY family transcriptional regulator [Anaerolineae bacterium]
MRADRLLSLMFLLHANGRMTAADLSEQLEVSERTVYRDIDALSVAGVPVYTQQGINGGIFLDENYRISLTGLSREQVASLFAASEVGPLADLGLKRAAEDSLLKLFATLPQSQRQAVQTMRSRLYIDPHGWFHEDNIPEILPPLQQAVWDDCQVEIMYEAVGDAPKTRVLDAYSLVSKSDVWYLVGRKEDGEFRSYRLSRLKTVRVLDTHFQRDPDFDLADYWQQARAGFLQEMSRLFGRFHASLHVHPDAYWYFGSFLEGRFERMGEPDERGWIPVSIVMAGIEEAAMHILSLGNRVWVDEPEALRETVYNRAKSVVDHIETLNT